MRALRLTIVAALSAVALSACLSTPAPTAEVGDCLNVSEFGAEVTELPTVSCDDAHEAEVFNVFDVTHEGDYDETAVLTEVEETCVDGFEPFVGLEFESSELDVYYLYPQAEGWSSGDREAICMVYSPNWETGEIIEVEGTLEGAAR
jgi:hypothetical protein